MQSSGLSPSKATAADPCDCSVMKSEWVSIVEHMTGASTLLMLISSLIHSVYKYVIFYCSLPTVGISKAAF